MSAHRLRHPPRRGFRGALVRLVPGLVLAVATTSALAGCGGVDPQPRTQQSDAPSPTDGSSTSPELAPDPEFGAPELGTCFRMTPDQSRVLVSSARKVSCKKPHTSVVARVQFLKKAVTPRTPVATLRSLGRRLCAPAYRRLTGGTVADRASSLATWTLFTPGRGALERGARWVRCDVLARSGNRLVPLPTTRPLLAQGVPEPLRVCQDERGVDVSCSDPHRFRVAAVFRAVGEDYPQGEAFTAQARDRCRELTGKFGGFWQPPSQDGWRGGDRFVRCLERAG